MRSARKPWLKYLVYTLFLALGIISLIAAFRDHELRSVGREIEKISPWWLVPVYISGFLGSLARVYRWKLVLDAGQEIPTRFAHAFHSLMFGYFVNLGTPRLGEISRCVYLNRKNKTDIVYALGTVAIERSVDVLCLLISLCIALVLQWQLLFGFYEEYIFGSLTQKVGGAGTMLLLLGLVMLMGIVVILWLRRKSKGNNFFTRTLLNLKEGLMALLRLKKTGTYLLLTLGIWSSYFLTSYLWLLAFGFTGMNTVMAGFTIMGIGAIAKSLPIQGGGAGAYHFLVSGIMGLFHITGLSALTYATVNHGSQLIYAAFFGVISLFFMQNRNKAEG